MHKIIIFDNFILDFWLHPEKNISLSSLPFQQQGIGRFQSRLMPEYELCDLNT